MKVVHKLEVPPILDFKILDAYPHWSFHLLQHSLNYTHSQKGENS